jgi:hypothetical protein
MKNNYVFSMMFYAVVLTDSWKLVNIIDLEYINSLGFRPLNGISVFEVNKNAKKILRDNKSFLGFDYLNNISSSPAIGYFLIGTELKKLGYERKLVL